MKFIVITIFSLIMLSTSAISQEVIDKDIDSDIVSSIDTFDVLEIVRQFAAAEIENFEIEP
jgi:hypothetical protein